MILQASNLVKKYQRRGETFAAVDGVSLALEAKSFTVLMGQSGCGKSTLFHLLSGMCRPDSGTVTFMGKELTALDADAFAALRGPEIGYVMQGCDLLNNFTIAENICMPCFLGGASAQECGEGYERASALLEEFGLGGMEDERPASLSGGERKRVAIARAFVRNPKLIIADEPTSDLDVKNSAIILEYLQKARGAGVTVLISTHDPNAAQYGDRVMKMEHGRLTQEN